MRDEIMISEEQMFAKESFSKESFSKDRNIRVRILYKDGTLIFKAEIPGGKPLEITETAKSVYDRIARLFSEGDEESGIVTV